MHKCLQVISRYSKTKKSIKRIIILAALGGRFDQEMANINELLKFENFQHILITHNNLLYLLFPGYHTIYPNKSIEGSHCGLIPVGYPAQIKTEGLKWNMNTETKFGALVSTSNEIKDDFVTISNSHPILWTSEIALKIK